MTIPDGVKKPQDRKKKQPTKAVRAEAAGEEFVTIEQCGIDISLPRDQGKWPLAATDYFSQGNHFQGIKHLIGDAAWQKLIAAGAVADDLNEIGEKFIVATGISAGN